MERRPPAAATLSPEATPGSSPGREARPAVHDPERAMRTCPICGKELAERKCKLYCPDPVCGYFLSCADFY
jgi:hypothetical protein